MKTKPSKTQSITLTTHRKIPARLTATLASLTLLALPAAAQTVLNHSFEVDDDSNNLANDGGFYSPPASWTIINVDAAGGGAYNPTGTNFTGATGAGTPSGADGTNVFSANVGTTTGGQFGASQVLTGTKLTAGAVYTMTVAIGDYADLAAANWSLGISTSSMLFGTFLNTASGAPNSLTSDQFNDFTVSYTATGAEGQIGEDLKITLWATKSEVSGQFVPFDNVRFTATAGPAPAPTFTVTITPNAANPGNYDFTWPSQDDKVYDLVSSTDLSNPPANWNIWDTNQSIDTTSPTHTLENVYGGGDTKRFFSVIERDP